MISKKVLLRGLISFIIILSVCMALINAMQIPSIWL